MIGYIVLLIIVTIISLIGCRNGVLTTDFMNGYTFCLLIVTLLTLIHKSGW
ncbi:hypothetical protein [uncultured Clostridium sp.]|jgi:hypothetical protein|uniref:hypothetical protein n=1 Tax=uncultured Clostridium sp. TaxID=59620 RepID=UPI00259857F5|nr:hypothetical protein [uncultured Clostridium sp.]